VPGHTACLAHLPDTDRDIYLAGLTPGADIDHRGTPFTEDLLDQLLTALRDPTTGKPRLGTARLGRAQFTGPARFHAAQFSGPARFDHAEFSGPTWFYGAQFSGPPRFERAQFSDRASFNRAHFSGGAGFEEVGFSGEVTFHDAKFFGDATFDGAQFSGTAAFGAVDFHGDTGFRGARFSCNAGFREAKFHGDTGFDQAQFSRYAAFAEAEFRGRTIFNAVKFLGYAGFAGAQFSDYAGFTGARFEVASWFGPVVCAQAVDLSTARFMAPITMEIAARELRCVRTIWESTATIRLRYATANFNHAVFSSPVAVTAHPGTFTNAAAIVGEDQLTNQRPTMRVASVQGVDAAQLVLTDADLTDCLFSGAFHLDQIRLEGHCLFASTPSDWHHRGLWPMRWTRRRTLAEEHHWRAQSAGQLAPSPGHAPSPRQWRPGPHHPETGLTPNPEDVAALYRQLRKAFEDGKNEPGAADFYYGECEMRRHDRTGTPKGERHLLWGYWLLSGYGLRASRAFAWLLAAMSLTVLLLMGVGLPSHEPDPALRGTWSQRMTWARAEKAFRVAVNSVVFRSSGQNLTTAGTYIEMASRLLEFTLLALGALAIRGRIKR
jgi:uncharacterized protein YjbI with pentapeptide repeats